MMHGPKQSRIALLTSGGNSAKIVFNGLSARGVRVEMIIVENSVPRRSIFRRRIKKLGVRTAVGQLIFQLAISRVLRFGARHRISELLSPYEAPFPNELVKRIESVNSDSVLKLLHEGGIDLILVVGTRIISSRILNQLTVPIINVHAGITPLYRGVHGGYWAFANHDSSNAGVTVHLIDAGIDTGGVLAQRRIATTSKDNFTTYPILQMIEAVELLETTITELSISSPKTIPPPQGASKLWSHPTAWQYVSNRLFRRVK